MLFLKLFKFCFQFIVAGAFNAVEEDGPADGDRKVVDIAPVGGPGLHDNHFSGEDTEVRPHDGVVLVVLVRLAGQDGESPDPVEGEVDDVHEFSHAAHVCKLLLRCFFPSLVFQLNEIEFFRDLLSKRGLKCMTHSYVMGVTLGFLFSGDGAFCVFVSVLLGVFTSFHEEDGEYEGHVETKHDSTGPPGNPAHGSTHHYEGSGDDVEANVSVDEAGRHNNLSVFIASFGYPGVGDGESHDDSAHEKASTEEGSDVIGHTVGRPRGHDGSHDVTCSVGKSNEGHSCKCIADFVFFYDVFNGSSNVLVHQSADELEDEVEYNDGEGHHNP